ncbi:MAG: cytidine deaminase, partial [Oscillospiraceae bacterium]
MSDKELIELAEKAREYSYSPYSEYKVGAALLCKNGRIYTGCNIESATYSPTNCAERTAFFKAVSEGEREFQAIAVVGGKDGEAKDDKQYFFPCGVCRQVM